MLLNIFIVYLGYMVKFCWKKQYFHGIFFWAGIWKDKLFEQAGQWGDILAGHFSVLAFVLIAATLYFQKQSYSIDKEAEKFKLTVDYINKIDELINKIFMKYEDIVNLETNLTSLQKQVEKIQNMESMCDSCSEIKAKTQLMKNEVSAIYHECKIDLRFIEKYFIIIDTLYANSKPTIEYEITIKYLINCTIIDLKRYMQIAFTKKL